MEGFEKGPVCGLLMDVTEMPHVITVTSHTTMKQEAIMDDTSSGDSRVERQRTLSWVS